MLQRLKTNLHSSFHPIGWTGSGTLYFLTKTGYRPTVRALIASIDFTTGGFVSTPIDSGRGYQENIQQPMWSPDGKRLAYVSRLRDREDDPGELMIRTDTGATHRLTLQQLSIDKLKAWTPDGRSLLVGAWDLQGGSDVYLVDAETGAASPIVGNRPGVPKVDFYVGIAWMPGGLSFLARAGGGGASGIYQVDTQTGDVSKVLLDPVGDIGDPAVSKDGSAVYYPRFFPATKQSALIERNLATGSEMELFRGTFFGLTLSPDGNFIATIGTDSVSNSPAVLLIPTAGGPARELLPASKGVVSLSVRSWTQDSKSLLLTKTFADSSKDSELWQMSLAGQQSRTVHVPRFAQILPSADNRSLAYTVTEPAPPATVEIFAMKHFLPNTATK